MYDKMAAKTPGLKDREFLTEKKEVITDSQTLFMKDTLMFLMSPHRQPGTYRICLPRHASVPFLHPQGG